MNADPVPPSFGRSQLRARAAQRPTRPTRAVCPPPPLRLTSARPHAAPRSAPRRAAHAPALAPRGRGGRDVRAARNVPVARVAQADPHQLAAGGADAANGNGHKEVLSSTWCARRARPGSPRARFCVHAPRAKARPAPRDLRSPAKPIAVRPPPRARYDAGGVRITATRDAAEYCVEVTADEARPMMLHWAVDEWAPPPDDVLPPGTVRVGVRAEACGVAARPRRRVVGGGGRERARCGSSRRGGGFPGLARAWLGAVALPRPCRAPLRGRPEVT